MRVDEKLQPGDIMHATLTYRQVLWDYHRYPIAEDSEFLCKIGATLLCIDRDHYAQYIQENTLDKVLEQVLPEVVVKQRKRADWSKDLLAKHAQLEQRLDPQESRLQ